jgi:hypothetical protein
MKLLNIALISAAAGQEGSGSSVMDSIFANTDSGISDDQVILEHRSLFGSSPFGAFFNAIDEPADDEPVDTVDEGGDEYEGELEGFDINAYSNSEAVKKVQEAVMFSNGFQRGQNSFGGINSGPSAPGVAQSVANRVEVLMKMIMYLQLDPSFDKFFQYGCYCFPDGEKAVLGGYGEARDGADLICKKYQNCQRCIDNDHVDCPEWAPYKYKGQIDKVTGKKHLTCLNKDRRTIYTFITTSFFIYLFFYLFFMHETQLKLVYFLYFDRIPKCPT